MEYTNILIIQTAFIGDAILASALVEQLHSTFPNAAVTILVRKGNEGIYTNHPFLKETLTWNKKVGKYRNLIKLLFKIRKNKYDLVVNCHRFFSSSLLTVCSDATHKAGYKQTPFSFLLDYAPLHTFGDGKHEVERYNQLVEDITESNVTRPKIYPSTADIEKIKPYQNTQYVCIAPSSVWFTKQLPQHKWIELCNGIPETTAIYILGSRADIDLANTILQQVKRGNIFSLCGKLSLLQSAALMQNAAMNYVNDSAPLHLASATQAPVTVFYCSTVKNFGFYPLSPNSTIIDAGQMDCRPCGIHGFKTCPKGHFNCGNSIDIQQVIRKQ